ncbi:MAG: efflux RND transporter periplasmic adaptor subunit [Arcticibacter sp.]
MKNIVGLFTLLLLWSCGNKKNTTENKVMQTSENVLTLSDEQLKAFTLTTVELEERNVTNTLKLSGMVDVAPQNLVSVSSALGGYVKSTRLLPGMYFRKGEVIALLEDKQFIELQQDYLTAKVQLQNLEAEYNRQKQLNESQASSDKAHLQAKANYETLLISKKALEEKLRLIHINPASISVSNIKPTVAIYAPFSGFVSKVLVNSGKYVSPTDALFELVDPHDLHLKLKVFEKDWDKLKVGQTLRAYTNSYPEKKYPAEMMLISKNITPDRAVEAYARFKGADESLIPGLYMNAEIRIPESKAPALPEESIVSFEGDNYVFEVLDKRTFRMKAVETGNTGDGWVEILSGAEPGRKKIVSKGAYTLLMALKNTAED